MKDVIELYVGNLRDGVLPADAELCVRIDRGHSVLANPFKMLADTEDERNRVCDEYEKYFRAKVARGTGDAAFRAEVWRLCQIAIKHKYLCLMCWCAPKRCHAETILMFIATMLRRLGYSVAMQF